MQAYLYCIIESKQDDNFGTIGIKRSERANAQSEVYTINYKDLSAVVSNFIGREAIDVLREGITHQKVVEEVMKKYEVLPMRFGQVPKSQEEIKGFLTENYDEIKDLFRKIEGKTELGLDYVRSWEQGQKPAQTTNFVVVIKAKKGEGKKPAAQPGN